MVVDTRNPAGVRVYSAYLAVPLTRFLALLSYIIDSTSVSNISCLCMENEARRRVQVLSSHNVDELRAFLKEKANEPPPPPASYMIGGIVRAAFPELCALRKKGYTLSMLVRIFQENGLRITATALSGYMKKLNREFGGESAIGGRKGTTQLSTPGSEARRNMAMKPDVLL